MEHDNPSALKKRIIPQFALLGNCLPLDFRDFLLAVIPSVMHNFSSDKVVGAQVLVNLLLELVGKI